MALLDAYRSALANVGGSGLGEVFGPGTQTGILQARQKKREEEKAREREGLTFVLDRAIKAGDRTTVERVGPQLFPNIDFGAVGQAAEREAFATQSSGLRDIADLLEGPQKQRALEAAGRYYALSRGETPTEKVPKTTYEVGAPRFMTEQEYGADSNLAGLLASAEQPAPTFARTLSPTDRVSVTLSKLPPQDRAAYKAFESNLNRMGFRLPSDPNQTVELPALVRGATVPTVTPRTTEVEQLRYPFTRGSVPKASGQFGTYLNSRARSASEAVANAIENLPQNLSVSDRNTYIKQIRDFEAEHAAWRERAAVSGSLVGLTEPSSSMYLADIPSVKKTEIEARTEGIRAQTDYKRLATAQLPAILGIRQSQATSARIRAIASQSLATTAVGQLQLRDEIVSLQLEDNNIKAGERAWERGFKTKKEYDDRTEAAIKSADAKTERDFPAKDAQYFTGTRRDEWQAKKDAARTANRAAAIKAAVGDRIVQGPAELPARKVERRGPQSVEARPEPRPVARPRPQQVAPPPPPPRKQTGGAAGRHGNLAGT